MVQAFNSGNFSLEKMSGIQFLNLILSCVFHMFYPLVILPLIFGATVCITCLSLCLLLYVSSGFHSNQNNSFNMCTGFWMSMMLHTRAERSQFPGYANSSQRPFRTIF
jgi:hypothetical protein